MSRSLEPPLPAELSGLSASTQHPEPGGSPATRHQLPAWFADVPWWVWMGSAGLIAYAALILGPWPQGARGPVASTAQIARLLLEAWALWWAGRRSALPTTLQRSLVALGSVSAISALHVSAELVHDLGGPQLVGEVVDLGWFFLSYVLAAGALLYYPTRPTPRRDRLVLATDVLISAVGWGALSWAFITAPSTATAPTESTSYVVASAVANIALVAALNALTIRGQHVPSSRAFWLFVAGQAAYLPTIMITQLVAADIVRQEWETSAYFGGVVFTLVAAVFFRGDPIRSQAADSASASPWGVSPFSIGAALAVGTMLAVALSLGQAGPVRLLTTALVVITALLVVRVAATATETTRLRQEEAEAERRRHIDKAAAIAKLAGGLSHELNNLMAVVIGHAELASTTLPRDEANRVHLDAIQGAGERAAHLVGRLLQFTGKQPDVRRPLDLGATVTALAGAIQQRLGAHVTVEITCEPDLQVRADAVLIEQALSQLAVNASTAMVAGGVVSIRAAAADLRETLDTLFLAVPAGRYACLSVQDDGCGIQPHDLPRIFDPFFSTQPMHQAAGLGLASVHGIVAAHDGGIAVDSTPGVGTTIRIYLPLVNIVG